MKQHNPLDRLQRHVSSIGPTRQSQTLDKIDQSHEELLLHHSPYDALQGSALRHGEEAWQNAVAAEAQQARTQPEWHRKQEIHAHDSFTQEFMAYQQQSQRHSTDQEQSAMEAAWQSVPKELNMPQDNLETFYDPALEEQWKTLNLGSSVTMLPNTLIPGPQMTSQQQQQQLDVSSLETQQVQENSLPPVAMLADTILQSSAVQSARYQRSNFFQFLHKLRDQELSIEGDRVVEPSKISPKLSDSAVE